MAFRRRDDTQQAEVGALLLAEGLSYLRASGQVAIAWARAQSRGPRKRKR